MERARVVFDDQKQLPYTAETVDSDDTRGHAPRRHGAGLERTGTHPFFPYAAETVAAALRLLTKGLATGHISRILEISQKAIEVARGKMEILASFARHPGDRPTSRGISLAPEIARASESDFDAETASESFRARTGIPGLAPVFAESLRGHKKARHLPG